MQERVSIDRRQFLGLGAGAASAALVFGMTGCTSKADTVTASPVSDGPSFLVPPDAIPDSSIANTVEAEIVIVGAGVSGLCAARAAAEAGAKVVVIEKADTYQYRSGQYGINGSQIQQQAGMEFNAVAAISDLMKEMGYRADQRLLNHWRTESGRVFDWFLEPAQGNVELLTSGALSYDPDKISLYALHFPAPELYDPSVEYSPSYPQATMAFLPNQGGILELNYQSSLSAGAKYHFATWARQLIRPNNAGRVEGVIAQDKDGNYTKFLASKAVVLCSGDYGNNEEMVKYYCGGRSYPLWFPNVDANGEFTSSGDGQKMGAWIGAKIEDGPHAPMIHTMGGALGVDAFFMANTKGLRFMNEDVAGQQMSVQVYRQPQGFAWQIFDDKYPEQVEKLNATHGAVNHVVDESANPHMKDAEFTIAHSPITSRDEVDAYVGFPAPDGVGVIKAQSIDELVSLMAASKMGLDEEAQASLKASIARYNELCDKGVDEDFGKVGSRMFPIATPPFYASLVPSGVMLVCLGGLTVDPDTLQVVDNTFAPIEGLYVAGNTMGGRIVQDYPVTIGGFSHANAMTFGKLVGDKVAAL